MIHCVEFRTLLSLLMCKLDLSFRDQLSNQSNRVSIDIPNNAAKSRVIAMGRMPWLLDGPTGHQVRSDPGSLIIALPV
jgi:hypothetical protein